MDPQQTQQFMHAFMGVYFAFLLIAFIVKIVLYTIPMWRICKRSGLAPQLALVCAVPLVGRLIATYIIAFSEWKVAPADPQYAYAPPVQQYPPQPPPAPYPPAPPAA